MYNQIERGKNIFMRNNFNMSRFILFKKNFLKICCFCFFLFAFSTANFADASISFSQDVNLSLTGISDGDLKASSGSSADYLSFNGAELTVSGIPDGSYFTLKTTTYNNALKITPSGGTATTTFNTANLSSGAITAWTLNASSPSATAAIVLSGTANTWYQISVGGSAYNSYQTNSSGELSFTYSGGFSSSKSFTVAQDSTAPTSFSLVSPVNNASVNSNITFQWNANTDPDFSHYQLYVDGNLNTNNLTSTSKTASLGCGNHTWYVKAVDNAGNSTNSSTFNLAVSCGGGIIVSGGGVVANVPTPKAQTIYPDGTVVYANEEKASQNNKTEQSITSGSQSASTNQPISPATVFSKKIKMGEKSEQVKQLQIILNSDPETMLAKTGAGSSGKETTIFGPVTKQALKKFQCKYKIVCSGNEETTGYGALGPKTRTKLNEIADSTQQTEKETSQSSQTKESEKQITPSVNIANQSSTLTAVQKQIEELQNQLLELLNNQLKELTKGQ